MLWVRKIPFDLYLAKSDLEVHILFENSWYSLIATSKSSNLIWGLGIYSVNRTRYITSTQDTSNFSFCGTEVKTSILGKFCFSGTL